MSNVNEILKEKFEINTEGKTLEQGLKEISDKWSTLDGDSQKELENLIFGYSVADDIKYVTLDYENITKEDMSKMLEENIKEVKTGLELAKKIEERLANDDGTRYTTEDIIRMREQKKLEREFKAKGWI